MSTNNGSGPKPGEMVTISELILMIEAGKLQFENVDHPTRVLLEQCRVAIIYLADLVPVAGRVANRGSRIVQP